jgi:hypothetical protein
LFALKKLLVSWGFASRSVYVDPDTSSMKICGVPLLEVSGNEGNMNINWLSKAWETWPDLQNNDDYQELMKKCSSSLQASQALKSKGAGKGPLTV